MTRHLNLRSNLKRGFAAAGVLTAAALVLAACAPGEPSAEPTTSEPRTGVISVVASTNVWASVAEWIGGDETGEFGSSLVEVVAIVDDPSVDPHSYEASARDQLAVSEAELIIANGGGYDTFMDQLVSARESEDYIFLKVVEGEHIHGDEHSEDEHHDDEEAHAEDEAHDDEGAHAEGDAHSEDEAHAEDEHDHAHGENEHVFYDLEKVREFAAELAATLIELRPEAFEQVNYNYDFFISELENIEVKIQAIVPGYSAIETAPLASLLLEAAGFELVTPEGLLEAVEGEREIPATALAEALEMLESGEVAVLVTNLQLLDSQAAQLQRAAEAAGVRVVALSELLLEGDDYLDFMHNAVDLLREVTLIDPTA